MEKENDEVPEILTMSNKLKAEKQCYDEIMQRINWLLNEAAGGKGINDYIPEDHDPETNAYIGGLYEACTLTLKCAAMAVGLHAAWYDKYEEAKRRDK
ncbi:MAG: hypothetical protein LBH07_01200 [Treponema sp.]|jgi:hypothetical protein|nr:hypothetical protein [Treponema sp.]